MVGKIANVAAEAADFVLGPRAIRARQERLRARVAAVEPAPLAADADAAPAQQQQPQA